MSAPELRELDAWIWKTIFNGAIISKGFGRHRIGYKLRDESGEWPNGGGLFGWGWQSDRASALFLIPHYTTYPADAMRVLKKCQDQAVNIETWKTDGGRYWVTMPNRAFFGESETLELAICLFAKKLFQLQSKRDGHSPRAIKRRHTERRKIVRP